MFSKDARPSLPWILILAGLLTAQACNYPTGTVESQLVSGSHLQQTFNAMDLATPIKTPSPQSTLNPPGTETSPFQGLHTATPGSPPPESMQTLTPGDHALNFSYFAQSGDTLPAIANRFDVEPALISSPQEIPQTGYIRPGQLLTIPNRLGKPPYPDALLPDSEVIFSPSTVDLDLDVYILEAGGFLASYTETVEGQQLSGADIVQRVAVERSSNPRLLLAFLEHRSNWVLGEPAGPDQIAYPIGFFVPGYTGLYKELTLAANHLNIAYYDWRIGSIATLRFRDGHSARISPALNAGSVAVQNLFSKFYDREPWRAALYGENSFLQLYEQMFGDPWARAGTVEPLLHPEIAQPVFELPFAAGESWSFTGGPHKVLNLGSPLGALDFGPVAGGGDCAVAAAWVTAPSPGVITRSGDSIVVLDLDADGYEQTGWVLFFMHIAAHERVLAGARISTDDPIGHPSCEGGSSTGAHVHIARKYNGEWIAADGPIPFVLSGWRVTAGERAYEGNLSKEGQEVWANPGGARTSIIKR